VIRGDWKSTKHGGRSITDGVAEALPGGRAGEGKIEMAVETLIIEDSTAARNILKQRLTDIGCEIVGEAADPVQGLSLFRSLAPKLVTLDLLMPVVNQMDAKLLFSIIRSESPGTAIIIISSQAKATEQAEFLRQGAMAYFQKPFIDTNALGVKLRQVFPDLPLQPMRR
jgi:CheY-like chemotaxis protein